MINKHEAVTCTHGRAYGTHDELKRKRTVVKRTEKIMKKSLLNILRDTSSVVVDVAPFRPEIQRAVVEEVLAKTIGRQCGSDVQDAITDITDTHIINGMEMTS